MKISDILSGRLGLFAADGAYIALVVVQLILVALMFVALIGVLSASVKKKRKKKEEPAAEEQPAEEEQPEEEKPNDEFGDFDFASLLARELPDDKKEEEQPAEEEEKPDKKSKKKKDKSEPEKEEPEEVQPVEEQPAPAPEEPKEAQPVVVNTDPQQVIVKQEPVQVVVEKSAPTIAITTNYGDSDEISMMMNYNRSFSARFIQSEDTLKEWYSDIKNDLLSYKNIHDRMSWKRESFRLGRDCVARMYIRGKTLLLLLALDPKAFEGTKYKVEISPDTQTDEDTPCLFRIKNPRRVKYAKELIAKVLEGKTEKTEREPVDYFMPFQSTVDLIKKGLIKRDIREKEDIPFFERDDNDNFDLDDDSYEDATNDDNQ